MPPLREVIAAHGLAAKKSLGQNFLLDLNLTRKIARAAGAEEGGVFYEVGPGPGGLTRALLAEGADKVIAVERDARCLPALAEIAAAYPGKLEVIPPTRWRSTKPRSCRSGVRIAANLPYNVGTALLIKWLTARSWPPFWASLTLMFQKEVAQRIAARPAASIMAGCRCWRSGAHGEDPFRRYRSAFVPPPWSPRPSCGSSRAPRRWRPARSPTWKRSPPPPSASAARCCASLKTWAVKPRKPASTHGAAGEPGYAVRGWQDLKALDRRVAAAGAAGRD